MRGVGDEGALRVEGQAQPLEQRIEGDRQRRDLVGQTGDRQRRQRPGVAGPDLAGEAIQRRQIARRQPADAERGEGRHQQQRQAAAPGRACCESLADLHRLGDLDDALVGRDAEGAPGLAADVDGGQAEQGPRRQRRVRPRGVDASAVVAPDLDDEIELGVGQAVGLGRGDLALVAQREGHLLQLVVEQRLGFGEHVAIGDRAHHGRRQQQQRQQRDQQADPDRGHGAPSMK